MAAPNPSEKNHYLPKFYTKQWASQVDGLLCQYDKHKHGVAVKRRAPEAVGFEYNLYTVAGVPEAVSRYLEETFLKGTDQVAADAMQPLLNLQLDDMTEEMKVGWTRFIMTLLQRNPQKVRWISRVWKELHREAWEEAIKALDEAGDAEGAAKLRAGIDPVSKEVSGVRVLQQLMDLPNLGQHIIQMKWRVFELNNFKRLLTSDRPVIMTNGLRGADSHIAIPLAPNKLFVAANNMEFLEKTRKMGAKLLSSSVNEAVVRQAYRYAYGEDDSQLSFVSKRIAKEPQFIAGEEMLKRYPLEV